ncbi:glucokinase [Roseomonas populi]|uniref:Glucokinase n=1 Tax=Roseomonas populi TaxID=3121582 RepID=A0ABT1X6G6_9PROT|nr:glucokinase [Roseomonas pecuniae]MCR0983697.1 glucokinase [Roseomonas pecuniae]
MTLRLVGDIGGTNARFALSEDGRAPRDEAKLPGADYPGPIEAAEAYLAGRAVEEAVLAVATPVLGDEVAFTNSPWRFSIADAKRRLGVERLAIINDFVAQASAVPHLEQGECRVLKEGSPKPTHPAVVLGPGTGLGVAFLVDAGGTSRVLPSEGGHASFAPQDDLQEEVLRRLRVTYGGHVSLERVLSGPGLLALARIIGEVQGRPVELAGPPDVSARAAAGDCPVCSEALRVFSGVLGAAAGNLALTLLADRGVYVTGGLCRNLGPLLDVAALRAGFTGKGRFAGYLEKVPVIQVMRPHSGLLGAAAWRIGG